jgi:hypothetical protein
MDCSCSRFPFCDIGLVIIIIYGAYFMFKGVKTIIVNN